MYKPLAADALYSLGSAGCSAVLFDLRGSLWMCRSYFRVRKTEKLHSVASADLNLILLVLGGRDRCTAMASTVYFIDAPLHTTSVLYANIKSIMLIGLKYR